MGSELDELLSGYIDGQLTEDELRQVDAALKTSAGQQRLQQLRLVGEDLRQLASARSVDLPRDFSRRVLATVQSREPALRLQATAWWRKPLGRAAAVAMVLTACLLLAVGMFMRFSEIPSVAPVADGSSAGTTGSTTVADGAAGSMGAPLGSLAADRDSSARIAYVMVLDLELSQSAFERRELHWLLQQLGIEVMTGVEVTDEIAAAVNQMRYTIPDDDQAAAAEVYLVRAPAAVLDLAVAEIEQNLELFPNYRFDLAFQTPTVSLSQAIADAAQQHWTSEASVAVPLVDNLDSQPRNSALAAIPYQGTLVSADRRQRSRPSTAQAAQGGEASYLLLFVRHP